MFQAWLVKIAKMAASSAPRTWPGNRLMKNTTVKDRKPRIGTDCRMSSSGTRISPARRLFAAQVAIVKVNSNEHSRAANIRSVVRTA